jgi:hypothetical protein
VVSPTPVHALDRSYLEFVFTKAGFDAVDVAPAASDGYVLTATR